MKETELYMYKLTCRDFDSETLCILSLVPRPPPSFSSLAVPLLYCKRRKAGRGTGNKANVYCIACLQSHAHTMVIYWRTCTSQWHRMERTIASLVPRPHTGWGLGTRLDSSWLVCTHSCRLGNDTTIIEFITLDSWWSIKQYNACNNE